MTRLHSLDIAEISARLNAYDEELLAKTGRTLRGIACYAAGLNEKKITDKLAHVLIGIIPIQWGKGAIGGFSKTTRDILKHIGFQTFVTKSSDVSGLAAAFEKGADIIFLADDERFVALNIACRRIVDNAAATGKGFAAGLNLMVGGLQGQRTLVIGCGFVGFSAAKTLANYGAKVAVYDIDHRRSRRASATLSKLLKQEIELETDLKRALSRHRFMVEATNSAGFIQKQDISTAAYIAAPGMPFGLSRNAAKKVMPRILHDPLQIGVATMGVEALKQLPPRGSEKIVCPEI